jgi:RND family efflux transporter MFP subunit
MTNVTRTHAVAAILFPNAPGWAAAPVVIVCQSVERSVDESVTFAGRLEASATVELRFRINGVLDQIHFKEGSSVKKGDLLFSLENRPLQARLQQAEAELAAADARLRLAEASLNRVEALHKSKAIGRDEVDQAAAQRAQAAALTQAARAQVEAMRIELEATRIVAPIDGTIGKAMMSPGSLVRDSQLATITRVDPIHVYFSLAERDVLRYRNLLGDKKDSVAIEVTSAADDAAHRGTVDFVDNRIDSKTGTLTVRGVLANPDGKLLPGMFARVRLNVGAGRKVPHIPEGAIRLDAKGAYVFVVGENNAAERRAVETGSAANGLQAVMSGLKPGEWVVVSAPKSLKAGDRVEPWPVTPPERDK